MQKRSLILVVVASIGLVWGAIGTLAWVASRHSSSTAPITTPGRLTQMEVSGSMESMLQQHEQMLEQMQTDVSPQMLARMQNDPMTQMLRSGEMTRLAEEHRAQIDCMLARTPCRQP